MESKTTAQIMEALKSMTIEERMAYLKAQRPEVFEVKAPVVSFGKAPKDGWTDADRVQK